MIYNFYLKTAKIAVFIFCHEYVNIPSSKKHGESF